MAESGNKITLELDLETGKFSSNLNQAQEKVEAMTGHAQGGFSRAGSAAIEMNQALELMNKITELVAKAFEFMAESISRAGEEEQAIQRLNQSLSVTNQYSEATSERFQKLAESIESTTSVSEGAVYSAEALATRYTKTADQTEKLTKAALELSSATGVSLDTAVMQLGMTTQGTVGRLGKMIPALKQLTEGELENGKAIDLVLSKYGGSSANTLTTFEGRMTNLHNSFENFQEALGSIIVKSPIVNAAIEKISGFIRDMTVKLEEFVSKGKFDEMVKGIVSFAREWGKYIIAPIELASNMGSYYFTAMKVGFQAIIVLAAEVNRALYEGIISPFLSGMETIASVMAKVFPEKGGAMLDYIHNLNEQMNTETKDMAEGTKEVMGGLMNELDDKAAGIFDFSYTDKFDKGLQSIEEFTQKATAKQAKFLESTKDLGEAAISVSGAFSRMYSGISTEASSLVKNAGKNFENLGKTMFNSIGSGAANAFSAFGKALATGKNALQAFANSLLNTLGSMAVQVGTQFILQGLAYSWAGMPNGPALIAAGAALAAFGGIMSGIGGGGASAPAGGGSSSSSSSSDKGSSKPVASPEMATEPEMKKKGATIVINGFLNTRETANHLMDVMRENSDITDFSITAQGKAY